MLDFRVHARIGVEAFLVDCSLYGVRLTCLLVDLRGVLGVESEGSFRPMGESWVLLLLRFGELF